MILLKFNYYNNTFLQYLNQALYQIDKLKIMFKNLRLQSTQKENQHFNIFKLHVMTHYSVFIRQFNSILSYDMQMNETAHKFLIK